MELLTEQRQIDVLREKCNHAKHRIWIASPYIGVLKNIRKIIGGRWLLPSVDCRILTDIDLGFIRPDTFDEFIQNQVEIRSLNSIHAKIYIVDDWCLVTSANLTGAAFLGRYEMGFATNEVKEVEATYNRWWSMATRVSALTNRLLKSLVDYQDAHSFKMKFKAQPYVSVRQDKYDAKCEQYREFAQLYVQLTGRNQQMVNDGFTLLQEVDYLFNFLYNGYKGKSSKDQKVTVQRSASQREKIITTYFKEMCNYYVDNPQLWRLGRARKIKRILSPKNINQLEWEEAKEVIKCLNCLRSYPINRTKFLNPKNNSINTIRDCWSKLLHTGDIDWAKIKYVNDSLRNFGLSSIYELIGWYYPDKYPLMNNNSDCGMRFFGYTI